MNELRSFSPSRLALDFSLVGQDMPDEFYETNFNTLLRNVYSLVQRVFCPRDNTQAPKVSPWLRENPDEFLHHIELVAHPDLRAGRWGRLLTDQAERTCLLTAIIFKVLDTNVFSSLLFGAGPEHEELLKSFDTELINAEGFQRTKLRAHMNRMHVITQIPPFFWNTVDKLCTQTLALLLPAYDYAAEFQGHQPTPVRKLHQALHEVIAHAGWINVHIRLAPAIFSFKWVEPGEPFGLNQINLCQDAYISSKAAAQRYQERRRKRMPGAPVLNSRARVKISVTPEIIRHKSVSKSIGTPGTTVYKILQPHVVYYEGLQLDSDEERAFMSLPEYIRRLREEACMPRGAALAIMFLVLLCLWVFKTTSGHRVMEGTRFWVNSRSGIVELAPTGT
ncbi:hypothetical protein LCI18_010498 [Fusarium solani-melongenae]|uniref:Uncharacterized protein n=1 Tax=Fusarium solani subsp. cucurbitae TaxID=2747967 RepID=A0ACD3ZE43_FUSSC|nr:hypothetical protein LCI18_010498 [Fusarium solani-melongenae]